MLLPTAMPSNIVDVNVVVGPRLLDHVTVVRLRQVFGGDGISNFVTTDAYGLVSQAKVVTINSALQVVHDVP